MATSFVRARSFDATWPILDDFGDPLKSKGLPKMGQKIQYGDFLASWNGPKAPKIFVWWGLQNTQIFEFIFNSFWLYFGCVWLMIFYVLFIAFSKRVFQCILQLFDRSFNVTSPKIIDKSLVLLHYFAWGTFFNEFPINFGTVFVLIFINFHDFPAIGFGHWFLHRLI